MFVFGTFVPEYSRQAKKKVHVNTHVTLTCGGPMHVVCCLLFNVCFRARVREAKIDVWVHVKTHGTLTCGGPMQSGFWIWGPNRGYWQHWLQKAHF